MANSQPTRIAYSRRGAFTSSHPRQALRTPQPPYDIVPQPGHGMYAPTTGKYHPYHLAQAYYHPTKSIRPTYTQYGPTGTASAAPKPPRASRAENSTPAQPTDSLGQTNEGYNATATSPYKSYRGKSATPNAADTSAAASPTSSVSRVKKLSTSSAASPPMFIPILPRATTPRGGPRRGTTSPAQRNSPSPRPSSSFTTVFSLAPTVARRSRSNTGASEYVVSRAPAGNIINTTMATAQASAPALSTPAARATTLGLPPATCEPTPVNSIGASPTGSAPKVARKLPDSYEDLRLPKLQRTRMPAYHTLTTQGLGPYLIL